MRYFLFEILLLIFFLGSTADGTHSLACWASTQLPLGS